MGTFDDMRTQAAVYWGSPVADGGGGYTFAAPVDITVRWEDSHVVFSQADGVDQVSDAMIFAGQALDEQGYLYLGTVASLAGETDPQALAAAKQIRQCDHIPSVEGDETVYEAYL